MKVNITENNETLQRISTQVEIYTVLEQIQFERYLEIIIKVDDI